MTNVLRETSQDREFLNRLRAFGLPDLSDAYLVSIDTSDGQHVRPTLLTCALTSATRKARPGSANEAALQRVITASSDRPQVSGAEHA